MRSTNIIKLPTAKIVDHLLVEFSSLWGNKELINVSDESKEKLLSSNLKLLSTVDVTLYNANKNQHDVSKLIDILKVGTEKEKSTPTPPPLGFQFKAMRNVNSNALHCPLKDIKIESPSMATVKKVQQLLTKQSKPSVTTTSNTTTTTAPSLQPNYYRTMLCIKILNNINTHLCEFINKTSQSMSTLFENVGYQLLTI